MNTHPTRRTVLAGGLAAATLGCRGRAAPQESKPMTTRLPVAFVGHGAPTAAIDPNKSAPWAAWGRALPRPTAVLVVSAHWEGAPVRIGATRTLPLIYDFSGFPAALYALKYPAPGAPALADRVAKLLGPSAQRDPERGLDHGAWVPLLHLLPDADVPVLQVTLPLSLGAEGVFDLGRRLAPLRDEGVLLVGSGNVTHNLRAMAPDGSPPQAFAREFDQWTAEVTTRRDWDALRAYREKAPALRQNHPREEHWLPLLFAAGAAADDDRVTYPVEGFEYGNLSRRSIQLG